MTIILQKGAYVELPEGLYPNELHQAVLDWSNTNCELTEPFSIKGPLSEIQLEYLIEESAIKKLERNPTFIVVGAIGGIAVVALAMSIFWGLNGSSFT
uniref:Uncharacterized protein n=1 Tax=Acrobeloides nanus TaxID=290746 RepID=A0A914DK20_9BILA